MPRVSWNFFPSDSYIFFNTKLKFPKSILFTFLKKTFSFFADFWLKKPVCIINFEIESGMNVTEKAARLYSTQDQKKVSSNATPSEIKSELKEQLNKEEESIGPEMRAYLNKLAENTPFLYVKTDSFP